MPWFAHERMLGFTDNILVMQDDGELESRITSGSLAWVNGKIVVPETVRFWKDREIRGNVVILDWDLLNVRSQQDHKI